MFCDCFVFLYIIYYILVCWYESRFVFMLCDIFYGVRVGVKEVCVGGLSGVSGGGWIGVNILVWVEVFWSGLIEYYGMDN